MPALAMAVASALEKGKRGEGDWVALAWARELQHLSADKLPIFSQWLLP